MWKCAQDVQEGHVWLEDARGECAACLHADAYYI